MAMNVVVEGLSNYILVFCRISGMIFFNPLLSRKNIPTQFNIALVLGISMLITPTVSWSAPASFTDFIFIWTMIKELLVGFCCGFVFQIFYYLLFTAGDVVDMGFGLSMAKAFDPGTNIQISMSGNIFHLFFVMYLFATNTHLIFIKLMASSYDMVPLGAAAFGTNVSVFMTNLFSSTFSLVIQLALPFVAAAFVLEISMGILMKLIPQINVFSIHFQFKIILGLILLFLFAHPIALFVQKYINIMFSNMRGLFEVI